MVSDIDKKNREIERLCDRQVQGADRAGEI
jgi:hypothetical protein